MFEKQIRIAVLISFASIQFSPAYAEPDAKSTVEVNQSGQCAQPEGSGGTKKHGMRGMRVFEKVRNLSSLTADQKEKIDSILTSYRQELRPLREQIMTLHQQIQGAGPDADDQAGTAAKTRLAELKPLIKQKSRQAWMQIKDVLSSQQLEELNKGRPGVQPTSTD